MTKSLHHNRKASAAKTAGKPKLTKAERKEKYTRLAHQKSVRQALRTKQHRLVCLRCRQRGHVVETCPQATAAAAAAAANSNGSHVQRLGRQRCCYKCGSTEHSLKTCPQFQKDLANNGTTRTTTTLLPFAECYVCGTAGHLASACPQNAEKGIYVNGGACKTCGSKQHLGKACPQGALQVKKNKQRDGDKEAEAEQYYANLLLTPGQGDEQGAVPDGDGDKPRRRAKDQSPSSSNKGLTIKNKKPRVVKFF